MKKVEVLSLQKELPESGYYCMWVPYLTYICPCGLHIEFFQGGRSGKERQLPCPECGEMFSIRPEDMGSFPHVR